MIANPSSTAANLSAALAHLARDFQAAPAPAPRPRSLASRRSLPVPAGAPRTLATARRSPSRARMTRPGTSSAAGYASGAAARTSSKSTSRSSSSSKSTGSLAFLKDPKLSIEEKLMKLLGYLNAKWEKEMQEKLDAIGGAQPKQSASGSSGSKKKSGGLLGSLGSVGDLVQSVVAPAHAVLKVPLVRDVLKQVGGPVLAAGATALGFPQLAPVLLKYGPDIVNAASSLASSLDGAVASGSSSSASGSSSKTTSSSSSKTKSDAETQTLLLEIQHIKQKQQEMFGLVSNVLKSSHDTRLAVVNNIR